MARIFQCDICGKCFTCLSCVKAFEKFVEERKKKEE